ncbi:MAG: hypothetical protein RLZZ175_3002 [Bacteroidota bacterium]|jgi:hypothetical protein
MVKKIKNYFHVETTIQIVIAFVVFAVCMLTAFYISNKYNLSENIKLVVYLFNVLISILLVKYYFKIAKYLMHKWEIDSDIRYAIIFLVFAITGSTSVRIATPILKYLNITPELGWYIYYPLRIVIILPAYQLLLITFGTIFGQFKFFWAFEKKMLSRFGGRKK